MMVLVLDLGLGNLLSIRRGLERAGAEVQIKPGEISEGPARMTEAVTNSDAIVLPGVGAFGDGMKALERLGPLLDHVRSGEKALLGICLGMQLLFEKSFEGGEHQGLGLISGDVVRLPDSVKIPHMGWNSIERTKDSSILAGIADGEFFYFVHSFYCRAPREVVVAECDYGKRIPATVEWRNIYGTQFHPEKSGKAGVEVLRNFLEAVRR
jgi:glutamine amidotransferase